MRRKASSVVLLTTSLVLAIGTQATLCDVATMFGFEAHHHQEETHSFSCLADHSHDEEKPERTPCNDECDSDLTEAQAPKLVFTLTPVLVPVSFTDSVRNLPPSETSDEFRWHAPRSDRPPQETFRPFSGRFLI